MKLSNIINGIELMEICTGANATEKRTEDVIAEYGNIESVCTDSRKCTANSLFIAVKGIDNDGHKYIGSAIEKGASAVICEYLPDDSPAGAIRELSYPENHEPQIYARMVFGPHRGHSAHLARLRDFDRPLLRFPFGDGSGLSGNPFVDA